MKNQNTAIGILAVTASLLLAAIFYVKPANADLTIKDRDYQVVTATLQQGGEALYICDVRTEQVAIFVYDLNTKNLELRVIRKIGDCFR